MGRGFRSDQRKREEDNDEQEEEEKADLREGKGTNRFPPCNLFVVPDAGYVGVSSRARIDECRLGDGQRPWDTRALLVVF